jgi:cytoskeletal protein CcmA (bactofilin family)
MGEKNNLIMNGSGNATGGTYDKVSIRGDGTISEDFECDVFKAYGSSDLLGSVKANQFNVYGDTEVKGSLISRNLKILGNAEFGSFCSVKHTKIRGSAEVHGRFSGNDVDVKGNIIVQSDMEVENLEVIGCFTVNGLLNADKIDVNMKIGTSQAGEIGGSEISFKRKKALLPFIKHEGYLEVGNIEGDIIELEYTKAAIVRGKKVRIGPGCEIGLVEYYDTLVESPKSKIKEKRKI